MINRCILHIGMHKTGSSSIQDSLNLNLDGERFRYAQLGSANHSGIMSMAFIPDFQSIRDKAVGRQTTTAMREAARARIRRELEQCQADTIIFSAEDLTRQDMDIQALHDFLQPYVNSVTVVGYVRSPRALLESGFQEILKRRLPPENLRVHYRNRLEKFDQIFGRENVELWKFEPKQFRNGCVVTDFCDRLAIPLQSGWIRRSNESLSRSAIAVLYAYRSLRHAEPSARWMVDGEMELVRRLSSLRGPRLWFSERLIETSMKLDWEQITWTEQRMGTPLAEPAGDGDGAIDSLAELLVVDDAIRVWLGQQTGREVSATISLEALVSEIEALVKVWGGYQPGEPAPVKTNSSRAKNADRAGEMVRAVLAELAERIREAPEGESRLPGVGRFVIRQVGPRQQVLFYPYIRR